MALYFRKVSLTRRSSYFGVCGIRKFKPSHLRDPFLVITQKVLVSAFCCMFVFNLMVCIQFDDSKYILLNLYDPLLFFSNNMCICR